MKYSIDDKNTTAAMIKRLRLEQKMSQQELASKAGVSFSFVNQVERGKQTVRMDALNKILEVFGYAMAPMPVGIAVSPAIGSTIARPAVVPVVHQAETSTVEPSANEPISPVPTPQVRQKPDWLFFD